MRRPKLLFGSVIVDQVCGNCCFIQEIYEVLPFFPRKPLLKMRLVSSLRAAEGINDNNCNQYTQLKRSKNMSNCNAS